MYWGMFYSVHKEDSFLWAMHHWNIYIVATDNTTTATLSTSGHEVSTAMDMISIGLLPFCKRQIYFGAENRAER